MKNMITRKSIVIFLAIALLMWLPCALGDEATLTDLQPDENQTIQDVTKDVQIAGKTTFRLTYKSNAEPSVAAIVDENLQAQIKPVMEVYANAVLQEQLTGGKTLEVAHNLRKITGNATVQIINNDSKHELTAIYTQDQKAETAGSPFGVQGEKIIDHMVITIKDPPAVEDDPPVNDDTGKVEQTVNENTGTTSQTVDSASNNNTGATSHTVNGNSETTGQNVDSTSKHQAQQQSNKSATGDKSTGNRMKDTREFHDMSDSGSNNSSPESVRDENTAPDGTPYNPDTGDTDKTGLTAVSGGAQGPSFNILDPVKTTDDTYKLVNRGTSSGTVSTSGSSGSGPAGAVTTATEDTKETTDETETDEKTAETIPTDNTYSISGGYNVMLIGVLENNTLSETWPLILQRGIVFEDFGQGENGAADTEGLLQTGMEGIRKEEDPGYWDAPSAVANAEDMILQFGFYKFAESEKKETDMDVLVEAATRLAGEGLTMNIRGVPFFMEVQLTGTTEEIDILRQLITELEINGYGGNTVLIFAQTGKGAENKPLVIIHPAISAGMTVKAPMKTEDVLATVLSLSGQATEKQFEILNTLPGQNLLTTEELSGIVGLVPEPKTVEETTAEETEKAGLEGGADGAKKLQMPEGFGKNGTLDRNEQEKNRLTIERTMVTTNSGGQGSGTELLAPGSEVQKSEGPGGSGDAEVNSVGPGGTGDAEVNSEGPGGSGNADDSNSAGPGSAGAGEVSSDGPTHP